jgi:two-component system chemotaxis sensor kinase CheA
MAFSLGEYGDIFLEEADEQLQELNQNLIELEKNPENGEIINNIFRAAHSLKSSAGFVGLNDLSDLAHKMENLLQGIRDKTLQVTPEIVNVIFKCFDQITAVIDSVAAGEEPTQDLSGLINEIMQVSESARVNGTPTREGRANGNGNGNGTPGAPRLKLSPDHVDLIRDAMSNGKRCFDVTVTLDPTAQMKWVKAQLVVNNLENMGDIVTVLPEPEHMIEDSEISIFRVLVITDNTPFDLQKACDVDLVQDIRLKKAVLTDRNGKNVISFETIDIEEEERDEKQDAVASTGTPPAETAARLMTEDDSDEDEPGQSQGDSQLDSRRKAPAIKTVKVSIEKLDQLLNNVGELVVANSGFYKLYDEIKTNAEAKGFANEFKNRIEQMSRIAKDLQNGIMNTRMVPIGQVFSRFNRLVRDLTHEFGKDVEMKISGEETELDKKVVDVIGEPLLHLIRNAIDHGIETDEERKNQGKPLPARVHLNAYQSGNQIFVEVSDDGRGLDVNVIKKKVIEKGLATREQIENMDDTDILNFIFSPGFSTAARVTDISGRGVGMNVVKETVSELNGAVTIETEVGMGTKFIMAFPLTLAIIPAIMVRVRKELYAIPLSDVLDTIKIQPADITTIEGHEVINFRGEILSVIRLNRFVGLRTELKENQKIPVVVVSFGNRKIGLILDQLEGKQEIVIKSLEQNYTTVSGLAGASILGDGSICLILDINSMINRMIAYQDKYALDEEAYLDPDAEDFEAEQTEKTEKQQQYHFSIKETKEEKDKKEEKDEKPSPEEEEGKVGQETQPEQPETAAMKSEDVTSKPEAGTGGESVPEEKPTQDTRTYQQRLHDQDEKSIIFDTPSREETAGDEEKPETEKDEELPPEEEENIRAEPRPMSRLQEEEGEVDERVKGVLNDFRDELRSNVQKTLDTGGPSDHMSETLKIAREELNEFQIIANIGAANAADSLSKILNKRIDLSIPEVSIKPIEKIPEYLGDVGGRYIGIMLSVLGDVKGSEFLVFPEKTGIDLVNMLYGSEIDISQTLNDDQESALKEVGNIVGSSVLNVFAEKTGLFIHPSIPTIVRDYLEAIIDSILVMHNIQDDYAIVMDTAFYFEDDNIVGNLMLLPEANSLKMVVENLKANVG